MQLIQQLLFISLSIIAIFLFTKKIREIGKNIQLGKAEAITDRKLDRWKNVLLLAFGQKKMFRNPLVAIFHFFVYAGFIIINIEIFEIFLDGIFGTHRLFANQLGSFYSLLINTFEVLAALVLVGCLLFLIRRNALKLKRFISKDLDGWPRSDANYILLAEILLMTLFFTMNATDRALQLKGSTHFLDTGDFLISGQIASIFSSFSISSLVVLERTAWWLHIVGIFAFLNYLPYSKHLHILLAFPNAYYARLEPMGKMENMPSVQNEVLLALQPELANSNFSDTGKRFGAKDVTDLSWKNLLDAYTCTECGRCSAACPATQTGKLLSPRKIMMDTRDRIEEIGKQKNSGNKSLLHDYISVEELRACTTCNACVQECPVSINPLDIILQLRRYLVMEESNAPQEWSTMFGNVENNFAPWKFSPDERDKWTEK